MAIRVILADDHTIIREGLKTLLSSAVELQLLGEAENGTEAWRLIKTLDPDVAILDISMPGLTGVEVAAKTSEAGLGTAIVLLTMHEDPAAVLNAMEAGASGYVLKDNTFEELLHAVDIVAAGGTFVTPAIEAKVRQLRREGRAAPLSEREREVVKLIALGQSSKEMARTMGISPRTVDTYRNRMMSKLDLHTLADVVRYALRTGIIT